MAIRVLLHQDEDIYRVGGHLLDNEEISFFTTKTVPEGEAWVYLSYPYLLFIVTLKEMN